MAFSLPERYRASYEPLDTALGQGWIERDMRAALDSRTLANPTSLDSWPGATRVKDSRNLLAHALVGPPGAQRKVWIKVFRPQGAVALVKRFFAAGKAERAWNTAFSLLDAGVATPRPLLGLQGRGLLGRLHGIAVIEDAGEAAPWRELLGKSGRNAEKRRHLIESLGGFLRLLHGHGFCHRDLSGGNILCSQNNAGQWGFSLIDLGRMRRVTPLPARERLRDLERIRLDEGDYAAFLAAYRGDDAALAPVCEAGLSRAREYRQLRVARSPWEKALRRLQYYWRHLMRA